MTGRGRGSGELTEQRINISLVPSGVYILELELGGSTFRKVVVKGE
jgi:hypothetical protein